MIVPTAAACGALTSSEFGLKPTDTGGPPQPQPNRSSPSKQNLHTRAKCVRVILCSIMLWKVLIFLLFGIRAGAHLQTPLPSHSHAFPFAYQGIPPGFGASTLGEAFAKLAVSDIDPTAAASFVPAVRSLDALRKDVYSVLTHPAYPRHSVRVKKSSICDGAECVCIRLRLALV
jgi:hypothetical protein